MDFILLTFYRYLYQNTNRYVQIEELISDAGHVLGHMRGKITIYTQRTAYMGVMSCDINIL